jgi:hypothetical protein
MMTPAMKRAAAMAALDAAYGAGTLVRRIVPRSLID